MQKEIEETWALYVKTHSQIFYNNPLLNKKKKMYPRTIK